MEIIIALIGTFTTIITMILTNYFSKKNELKFAERKLKETYYLEYIECVSDNINYSNEESTLKENKAFNELILIASKEVLEKLYFFQDLRIRQIKFNDIENYKEKYDKALKNLIIEIRKDLYGRKEIQFPNIYLLGGFIKNNN